MSEDPDGRVKGLLLLGHSVDLYEARAGICNIMDEEKEDRKHKVKYDTDSKDGADIIIGSQGEGGGGGGGRRGKRC